MIGVHEEGALQPRLVPLRVHEGGVHVLVQELLVEQDAAGELHCGSTQITLFGPENCGWSAVLIIVFHPSSALVRVRAKKKKTKLFQENLLPGNHHGRFTWIRESFVGSR